jgi:hypothetical protein
MQAAIIKVLEHAAPSYTASELKEAETVLRRLMATAAADGIDLEAEVSRKERGPGVADLYRLFQLVSASTSYLNMADSELIIELFSIAILNGYERSSVAHTRAESKAASIANVSVSSQATALADNLERRLDDLTDTTSRRSRNLVAKLRSVADDADIILLMETVEAIKTLMTPKELAAYEARQRFSVEELRHQAEQIAKSRDRREALHKQFPQSS